MNDSMVFDTTESTRLLPAERPVPTVSRVIVRDALANLGPGARISHRVGGHSDQYNGVAVSPTGHG